MKLADYRKIAAGVEKRKVFVEEKEVEAALRWLQQSRAKFSLKNQPAQKGDFVEIDCLGRKDAFILGQGHFVAGFEEAIVGMKAGEEKDSIKDIKVKLISVQNIELPELTDDFARGLGDFRDLVALKKSVGEGLNLEKEQAERIRWRSEVLERISQQTECEVPENLVLEEQSSMIEKLKKQVPEFFKISFQEYLGKIKKTEKELSDSFLPLARKKVKNLLILKEVGKKELDSEEIKKYTEEEKIEKIFKLLESL